MNHKFIKLLFLLLLSINISYAKELKKVTLQLSWFDQFQFAGYYMAKEKGYYEEFGLDVTILPFKYGLNIPKDVSKEKIDFSIGRETLILDKSKYDIVALYALFQSTPLILLTTKSSGIKTINDFTGKNIMTTIDDAGEVSLKAMIQSHKVNITELNFLKHTHNLNDLLDKKTDIISAYISKAPFILKQKNIKYTIFDPKKFGFDMYSDFLFTSATLIKKDPILVNNMKKASLKGWEYAYSNIKESATLIMEKYNPSKLSKEELIYEANELKKLSYYNTKELGLIKKEKIQRVYDLYNIMGLVKEKININSFLIDKLDTNTLNYTKEEMNYIKYKKNISMCVITDSLPYGGIKDNEFVGFIADYMKEIEKKIKIPLKTILTVSWFESLSKAKKKECDILSSAVINKERKKYFNFTKDYFLLSYVLITKNEITFIDDLSTLSNIKISITKGYAILDILKRKYPKIEFIEVDNTKNALKKVFDSEYFAHVDTIAISWYLLQKQFSSKLKISGKLDIKSKISIAVRNDDQILFNILNKAVESISDSKRDELLQKWVSIEYKDKIDYKVLAEILFVISILFIFLLYKQSILNNKNKNLNFELEIKKKELEKANIELENKVRVQIIKNEKKNKILAQQAKKAALGEMIANIAHQWRQPLNNINLLVHFLRDNYTNKNFSQQDVNSNVHDIYLQINYMSKVIDDFRAFFKPSSKEEEFDLNIAVEKSINLISAQYAKHNIQIIKDINKIKLITFENELMQVLINIFNNAKDELLNNASSKRFIFISAIKEESKIIIKIRDNAGGINDAIISKIFDPYFTTKDESKGTGIGLYMSELIISKHMNGTISVNNEEFTYKGEKYLGAEFTIILNIES